MWLQVSDLGVIGGESPGDTQGFLLKTSVFILNERRTIMGFRAEG